MKVSFNCAHASHLLAPSGLELLGEKNTDNMEVVKIKWLYMSHSQMLGKVEYG